jgi:hypothetical protein
MAFSTTAPFFYITILSLLLSCIQPIVSSHYDDPDSVAVSGERDIHWDNNSLSGPITSSIAANAAFRG